MKIPTELIYPMISDRRVDDWSALAKLMGKASRSGSVKQLTKNESRHIQFEFSSDMLDRLKEKAHASSYGELIRDALYAYRWMVNEKEAGHDIGAIKDGEILNIVSLHYGVRDVLPHSVKHIA